MEISNFIKYIEEDRWLEFCKAWDIANSNKTTYEKIIEIENFQSEITKKINEKHHKKIKKWLFWNLSTSWLIENDRDEVIKKLIKDHLHDLHSEQLITILKPSWEYGRILESQKILKKILEEDQLSENILHEKIVLSSLSYFNDPLLTAKYLFHTINYGHKELTLKAYVLFYKQYFYQYAIDDEEAKVWDDLWNKISERKEAWHIWELLKLDIGLITDIVIKNKTGLKIPYFRKKREIAQAIVLRNDLPTLYATLLKYFYNIENTTILESWLNIWESEKQKHGLKYLDKTIAQILFSKELEKPKTLPGGELTLEEEDATSIATQIQTEIKSFNNDNTRVDFIEKNILEEKTESKIKIHFSSLDDQKNWKEQLNVFMLHGQYQNALDLIKNNEASIREEDQGDYELLYLELMLKLKQFQEVLLRLEEVWKRVQELETFKNYKYIEAEALWGLNRKREAADCFRKVVDIDPNYKLARWRLVEYSL